jgi:hypothetical protein
MSYSKLRVNLASVEAGPASPEDESSKNRVEVTQSSVAPQGRLNEPVFSKGANNQGSRNL